MTLPVLTICMWVNIIYYLRGFIVTGHYVRMLSEILVDMAGFTVLVLLILTGFSHALVLVVGKGGTIDRFFAWKIAYGLGIMGDIDGAFYDDTTPGIMYFIFIFITFVVTTIYLNVLRAELVTGGGRACMHQ